MCVVLKKWLWCCFGCEKIRHVDGELVECEDQGSQEARDVQLTVLVKFEMQEGGTMDITLSRSEQELRLSNNQLSGPISEQLGNLPALQVLYLHNNQLSGPIPEQLGKLPALQWLNLSNNKLNGPIPEQLGNLPALQELRLSNNNLSGPIPEQLGNLPALQVLHLSNNELSGPIPEQLGNLPSLQRLHMSNNQLSGPIPEQLGNLPSLQRLHLSNNQLSGPIPEQLGNLPALQKLDLSNNQLSGPIPEQLGNLPALQVLYLSNNQLSGPIPEQLGNLPALQQLILINNQLSGPIPEQLGNLPAVQVLNLSDNQLSGPIPEQLGILPALQWLYLSDNQLSGPIPEQLGNLPALEKLDLSDNQLSGPIPENLGNLSSLQWLNLISNQLSGSIPEELGNLPALQVLRLSNNQLSGPIPEQLGNLPALQGLHLSNNHLEGKVPPPLVMKLQIEVSLKINGNSELIIGDVVSLEAPQFPVFLVPRDHILNLSAFQTHEKMKEQGMLCKVECKPGYKLCNFFVTETKEGVRREDCVFVSHRWLQEKHPDDAFQTKLHHIKHFAQQHPEYLFYWVDYACIPQADEHGEDKGKAINSLPCYVKTCGSLVAVYSDKNERSSLLEYKQRGWCRLEQLSSLMPIHTTKLYGYEKGDLATTKVYLSELGGEINEVDLERQGMEALMELNPLEGVFFDYEDKQRISECLSEMCKVLKTNPALENLVHSIHKSQALGHDEPVANY